MCFIFFRRFFFVQTKQISCNFDQSSICIGIWCLYFIIHFYSYWYFYIWINLVLHFLFFSRTLLNRWAVAFINRALLYLFLSDPAIPGARSKGCMSVHTKCCSGLTDETLVGKDTNSISQFQVMIWQCQWHEPSDQISIPEIKNSTCLKIWKALENPTVLCIWMYIFVFVFTLFYICICIFRHYRLCCLALIAEGVSRSFEQSTKTPKHLLSVTSLHLVHKNWGWGWVVTNIE